MSAWLALVRLQLARLAELADLRAARLYAIGMALSFGLLAGFAPGDGGSLANHWLAEALTAASWAVAGLSTLGLGRDLERRDRDDGFGTLGHVRGFARAELASAQGTASALWVAAGVALPAWLVLGISVLVAQPAAGWALFWGAFVAGYAAALALALSLLARAARRLAPRDARVVVALLVLGPELLRLAGASALPTLPHAFGVALASAESFGKGLA